MDCVKLPDVGSRSLTTALIQFGFVQSYPDYSLFTYCKHNVRLHMLIYVDDLIIGGNDTAAIVKFKSISIGASIYLGPLKYFLGIEVAHGPEGIFLSQRKYALDIISKCGFLGAKPTSVPIEQNHHLALAKGTLMENPNRYRRLVGRLIYLTITRPELCYCIHILAQFMQSPRQEHWDAALRVVRYMKGYPGQGLLFCSDSDLRLYAYCDSDWASFPLTRRSLIGYFVLLGQTPVSWKTKKQHTMSRSSTKAEYRSMVTTSCELKWMKKLLLSFGVAHDEPARLYCDNQVALHIVVNLVFHERTKHIEVNCHFVRDELQRGNIVTCHVRTTEQLADILTKALGKEKFAYFLGKLGIRNLHTPI
ncbi:PREDICTED: uncharacterized protein LOC109114515 [Nelumbo nucifera]|uniref:Uncharacterized protein LOC109114515 n=1 Tax=Nelumbo nucifera TaxID=4432 RepID=A0A1U8Q1W0_NELNU|nr:PREDICTED: uncharacterized protein LOC109114515 [Nelumbo nucifera]